MCNKAVEKDPSSLFYVPDQFKTQDMCIEVVFREPTSLFHASDHFKTQ